MTKASDNEFPSVLFAEQGSDPSTPGAGLWRAFFKAGGLYVIDDAGNVTGPFGSGSSFHGCQAYSNTTQGFGATTETPITFGQEDFDTDAIHDTGSNTSRFTIPSGLDGVWMFTGFLHYNVTSGDIYAFFKLNNTTRLQREDGQNYGTASLDLNVTTYADLSAGDYVELIGYHSQAGTQTVGSASIASQQSVVTAIFLG